VLFIWNASSISSFLKELENEAGRNLMGSRMDGMNGQMVDPDGHPQHHSPLHVLMARLKVPGSFGITGITEVIIGRYFYSVF
jgi:hypothetical protein